MQISILTGSADHPINTDLQEFCRSQKHEHEIDVYYQPDKLPGGELLFLISYGRHLPQSLIERYKHTLVLHASDLPEGRGWSPHIWQILEGREEITVSAISAADEIDSGDIWVQQKIRIPKTALYDEINQRIFDAEFALMKQIICSHKEINPQPQRSSENATSYPKRAPADSQIDSDLSIAQQWNLLRVCDPDRYPAFVEMHGQQYKIILERHEHEQDD